MNYATIDQIEDYSCKALETTIEDVRNWKGDAKTVDTRRYIVYFLFHYTKMQTFEVEKYLNMSKNKGKLIYNEIRDRLGYDKSTREIVRGFKEKFKI